MITFLEPLAVGNAIRVFLQPATGAENWVVLRNTTGVFASYNDPAAVQVYAGADTNFVDTNGLANGTLYYYGQFYYDGAAWHAENVMSVTPASTYQDQSVDMLSIVHDRLLAGLSAAVTRGLLKLPASKTDGIKVLTAPPVYEDTAWPVVTVHLLKDAPAERFLGEVVLPDAASGSQWIEGEGWFSRWNITIVGWALNPDERIALRQNIKAVLIANLPVFQDAGALEVQFDMEDVDSMREYPAPVYQAVGNFSCLAPSVVTDMIDGITAINTTSTVTTSTE